VTDGARTRDSWSHNREGSEIVTYDHNVTSQFEDAERPSNVEQPLAAAASIDPVEEALVYGLRKATDAGEWEVAGRFVAELEARRKARETKTPAKVLTLDGKRLR
jgi:hypothetical protein